MKEFGVLVAHLSSLSGEGLIALISLAALALAAFAIHAVIALAKRKS
jgi:hypothetical protein